jgi:hypothetical protein
MPVSYASGRRFEPLEPPDDVAVTKVYYTRCTVCGALSDYSDTLAEARRNARWHKRAHEKRLEIMLPLQ